MSAQSTLSYVSTEKQEKYFPNTSRPSCSELMMLLVIDLLKFTLSDMQIMQHFFAEKM